MRFNAAGGIAVQVLLAVAALALGGAGVIYGVSEWKMRRSYDAPLTPLQPHASVDTAEGERMARILGCWDGCHGRTGEGGHWEIRGIARSVAPTLTPVLQGYDDAHLVRLIRYGVKRDGTSAVGMPSYTFWPLGDDDLANVIAHLRRQAGHEPMPRERHVTWQGRLALLTGRWQVSAQQVDRSRPRLGDQPQRTPLDRGRYLASITCTECHGTDFDGNVLEGTPSLAVVGTYTLPQFRHLMRTAQAASGRTVAEDMQWVKSAPFTDAEIDGLYQFLRSRHGFAP